MSLLLEALKKAALEKQDKANAGSTTPVNPITKSDSNLDNNSDGASDDTPDDEDTPASMTLSKSVNSAPASSSAHLEPHFLMPNNELSDVDKESATTELSESKESQIEGVLEHSWDPTLEFDIEVDESLFTDDATLTQNLHQPTWSEPDSSGLAEVLIETPPTEIPEVLNPSLETPTVPAQEEVTQPSFSKTAEDSRVDTSTFSQDIPYPDQATDLETDPETNASPEQAKEEEAKEGKKREETLQIALLKENLQRKIKAEGQAALEHLIKSGQALERSKKHRARFLYAMLIMTAFGGIVSYYFYLLADSNISELQSDPVSIVDLEETTLNLDPIQNVYETNQISGPNTPAHQDTEEPTEFSLLSNENMPTGANIPSKIENSDSSSNPISGSLRDTSRANNSIVQTPSANPEVSISNDQAALSNFSTLTGLGGNNDPQKLPTRVIVHHRSIPATVSADIQDGYRALQNKNYVAATVAYEKAVAQAPKNRDAILGAAAAAAAQNRMPEALKYYQQQLNLDPQDSYARAGILSLANSAGTQAVQRELDTLILTNPNSAHLHFLKGTNLAASKQWTAAQQSFFEAYFRDKGNPDYAFNLAISLDHLNQREQAIRFYNLALENNKNGSANFGIATANKRLTQLKKLEANNE
ncbi:MAG: tetratricopeptide (TPR) repeat protein [Candidatus Azotimanducaceae bacterium]|jgi:tetratricopeptide (TPR) repeat protein